MLISKPNHVKNNHIQMADDHSDQNAVNLFDIVGADWHLSWGDIKQEAIFWNDCNDI